jgi:hypothetical protein
METCPNRQADCDDLDATINPGQEEVRGNWIDDDCDGQIDEVGRCVKEDDVMMSSFICCTSDMNCGADELCSFSVAGFCSDLMVGITPSAPGPV